MVGPCCRADTWVRPVLVQALVGGLNLVKGPGAEEIADFVMPDCDAAADADAAAAATAAAASGAAPKHRWIKKQSRK